LKSDQGKSESSRFNTKAKDQEKDMPTIMPEGERVRLAVKFISAERQEDEKKSIRKLIQEASLKFNLSPKEEQDLVHFYREK
jgi:hypothetical protein